MSWGYRFSIPESARAEGIEGVRHYDTRIATSGQAIPYLRRVAKKAKWGETRYGMTLLTDEGRKLFWNARKESLKANTQWNRLLGCKIAIPIDAYVESSPVRTWHTGPRAWVPGLLNLFQDGGIVTITEQCGEGGKPILLDQDAAIAWLDAEHYNAIETLGGNRIVFDEADIFVAARLDAESKRKVSKAA